MKAKKYFFSTEQDEVVNFKCKKKTIGANYKYIHTNVFYKFFSFITYRIIAMPIAWIYLKLFNNVKFINKKVLKSVKTGYFIYANHTNQFGDAIWPTFICFPKKPNIIVNPENIHIPIIGKLIRGWGALPLPDSMKSTKNFRQAINVLISNKQPILIYPESHLWPYYTKIRKFSDNCFRYPAIQGVPIFTFTTTYHKNKFFKKPKIKVYVDGPFYPTNHLNLVEKKQELKNWAFNQMLKRAQENTFEYAQYIKRSKND